MKFFKSSLLSKLLAVLTIALPFERIPSVDFFSVTIRPSLIVGGVLIVAVAILERSQTFKVARNHLWLYAFLGSVLISSILASHPRRALMVFMFILFVVLLATAVASVVDESRLEIVRKWIIRVSIVVGLFALYQFFGDLAGLPPYLTGLREAYTKEVFGFPRIQGASLEPLYFANFLLLPTAVLLAFSFLKTRLFWPLLLMFTCFFLSVSRGGVAGAILLLLIFGCRAIYVKRYKLAGVMTGAAVIGLTVAYILISIISPKIVGLSNLAPDSYQATKSGASSETYKKQVTNYDFGNSKDDRTVTRNLAIELFKSHPILGIGPGNFGHFAHQTKSSYAETQTVNSLPIELLTELGIIGFAIFLIFIIILLSNSVKTLRVTHDPKTRAWIWALVSFMVAFTLQSITLSPLYIISLWFAIGLLMGINTNRKFISRSA